MQRIFALCVLVSMTGGLAVLEAHGAGEAPAEIVAQGKALAQEKCARCHAVGLEDTSTHKAAPPFRDVIQRYPIENLAEALAEGIVSGHPDMPVFAFEPAEIEALLAYLDQLRGEAADDVKGR